MKGKIQVKLFCIVLIVSMLTLGMYCKEEPMPSSPFSHTAATPIASITRMSGGVLNSHIYHEENRPSGLGEFTLARANPRSMTILRLNPLLLQFFWGGAFTLTAIFFSILSLQGLCRNQYGLRTLQYIHHKDGRKHNSKL